MHETTGLSGGAGAGIRAFTVGKDKKGVMRNRPARCENFSQRAFFVVKKSFVI